ncbi:FCD domain-containing protein [Piscinibacter sp.]|uniref:FCD domain-containing protein n=1 Tax=Piscinibacter sp. TaxID=1903157 RepID=UPI003784ED08
MQRVFEVRRALERAIAANLATRWGGQTLALMRGHLDAENRARGAGDRAELARLTGLFQVRLAKITENRLFSDDLRRQVALTSLVIAQYDAQAHSACPEHEHEHEHSDIIEALEAGDTRRAERLMLKHLDHVEAGIQPPTPNQRGVDFEEIVSTVAKPSSRRSKQGRA